MLITGAGGFIGSHLAERLVELGARVRCFLRYTSQSSIGLLRFSPAHMLKDMELVFGDLRDADAVRRVSSGCQTVFHLGALISIPYSYVHPREVVDTNVMGALNILEAARTNQTELLVHTSSSEVYGTARYVPMDERHPLQGQSPYSASKIAADRLVESYWRSFGIAAVTIRPFNTYGPRQSARAVIPTIISQALRGDTVQLGNLHPTRDLTYVTDTVAGFIAVAETDGLAGQELNLGSGREISIANLVERVSGILGKSLQVTSQDVRRRPTRSEVERLYADTSKAQSLLHWRPQIDLDRGLKLTIDWMAEHLDCYAPEAYQI